MSEKRLEGAELVKPYSETGDKGAQVEEMFDSIAPKYDFMNTAMTFGLHRYWRDRALMVALRERKSSEIKRVLDVATGTGDVAFWLHRQLPEAAVKGIDLSEGMLKIAREKQKKHGETDKNPIEFSQGDCLNIDSPDNTFDFVSVAYGVRNFEHLDKGYDEIYRVMAPGGVLCVIELSVPENALTRAAYNLYSRHLIPAVGQMVSGDSRAYSYLPESIAAAPQRKDMARLMQRSGFKQCRWKSLTFGAVTFYIARKPAK